MQVRHYDNSKQFLLFVKRSEVIFREFQSKCRFQKPLFFDYIEWDCQHSKLIVGAASIPFTNFASNFWNKYAIIIGDDDEDDLIC